MVSCLMPAFDMLELRRRLWFLLSTLEWQAAGPPPHPFPRPMQAFVGASPAPPLAPVPVPIVTSGPDRAARRHGAARPARDAPQEFCLRACINPGCDRLCGRLGAVIATTPARAATPSEVTDPSPLLCAKMLGSASCLLGLFCACLGLLLGLSFACCSPQPFWFLSPAPLSSSGAAHGCPRLDDPAANSVRQPR